MLYGMLSPPPFERVCVMSGPTSTWFGAARAHALLAGNILFGFCAAIVR